ncbi:putative 3' exoribonuclease family protein [Cryptosporidium serpentis]
MESFITGIRESGLRIDGRTSNEFRKIQITLNKTFDGVEVKIGKTHVLCIIKAELMIPNIDRPSEGQITFSVDYGPLSLNPNGQVYRHERNALSIELANYVERTLRETGAFDTEVLCIISGLCAWSIRCDIRALCDDGNLFDTCLLATLSAFKHFRYKDIDCSSFLNKLKLNKYRNKDYLRIEQTIKSMDMIPLNIHHFPLSISIGYIRVNNELQYIVDPCSEEESILQAVVHIAINGGQQVCGLSKPGGEKLTIDQINFAIQLAKNHGSNIHEYVKKVFIENTNEKEIKVINVNNSTDLVIPTDFDNIVSPVNSSILSDFTEIKIDNSKIVNNEYPIESTQVNINNEKCKYLDTEITDTNTTSTTDVWTHNKETGSEDNICKTLEQVRLNNLGVIDDLNSALKTNVKLKRRKRN